LEILSANVLTLTDDSAKKEYKSEAKSS